MKQLNKIRLPLDIMMTLVSIVLMGGNFLFPADIVHEILGVGLFVLWGVHIFLNRRWYASLAQTISAWQTAQNHSSYYSCPALCLRSLRLHHSRSLEVSYPSPAIFLLWSGTGLRPLCFGLHFYYYIVFYNLTFNSIKIKKELINQDDQMAITINLRYTGKIMQHRLLLAKWFQAELLKKHSVLSVPTVNPKKLTC